MADRLRRDQDICLRQVVEEPLLSIENAIGFPTKYTTVVDPPPPPEDEETTKEDPETTISQVIIIELYWFIVTKVITVHRH